MIAAYSNKDEKHENEIIDLVEKYHIGALIFFQDDPIKQVELTNKYQKLASAIQKKTLFGDEDIIQSQATLQDAPHSPTVSVASVTEGG